MTVGDRTFIVFFVVKEVIEITLDLAIYSVTFEECPGFSHLQSFHYVVL